MDEFTMLEKGLLAVIAVAAVIVLFWFFNRKKP
jgi:hypothetical protein